MESTRTIDQACRSTKHVASLDHYQRLQEHLQWPGVIAVCDCDQSHHDIAIWATQKSGHVHIHICNPMNQTQWLYKYYFIRFEICRKGIFNVFCIFHLLNEIHGVKCQCDKPDSKGSLKLLYFISDLP